MNRKNLKVAGIMAAVLAGFAIWERPGVGAQGAAVAAPMTTNWVGGLVIGKKETGDPIAGRGLFPQADAEVEIGLRSDGMMVWRKVKM